MDMGCYSLRGFGKSLVPTVVSLLGSCVLRIVWIFAVFYPFFGDNIAMLYICYPITWTVTGGIFVIFLLRELKKHSASASVN